jgi:hypothetical protein
MLHRITTGRRLGRALVAAVVAAGALPAGATAATLEREFDDETLRCSGRIASRGRVSALRRPSRLTHRGATVSARLALRLDRSLAGRRLRVDVEAVDAHGARQVERHAGSIRVAR